MLEVLQNASVYPKIHDDPDGAPVQPIARHRGSARPGICNDVLDLARKTGPNCLYFLLWHQRQDSEENDTNPCQQTKRCSEEARAHRHCISDNGSFGKPVIPHPTSAINPANMDVRNQWLGSFLAVPEGLFRSSRLSQPRRRVFAEYDVNWLPLRGQQYLQNRL